MSKFSHDVVILGGGAGGLSAASGCAQLGLKTALVEKERLGGDCLYYGCVPSKTLLKSARVYRYAKEAERFGLPRLNPPEVDLGSVMGHVRQVIEGVAVHDSPERFRSLGAEVYFDQPEFVSPHQVRLRSGETLSARTIIIATGSSPRFIPIKGLKEAGYITNMDVFSLRKLPKSLVTIGAGPIGIELSQAFLRLGARVTIIDVAAQVVPLEDEDVAVILKEKLEREGARLMLGANISEVSRNGSGKVVTLKTQDGGLETVEAEEILLAVGRRGNGDSLKPEQAGLNTQNGYFQVDQSLSTAQKHILAIGDSNGKFLFTHVAGAEGSLAVKRTVFRLPARMDYNAVPWVTYTDPEIASIGYNEKRARQAGIQYSLVVSPFRDTDRAMAEAETEGKIKILIDKKSRIIGTQIVGAHAGELLLPSILAVRNRYKLMELVSPIFPYPVLSEVMKKAASSYFAPKLFNPRVRGILRALFRYRGPGPRG